MNDIAKLAIDTYKGSLGEFSDKGDANVVLRQALTDTLGGKFDYKAIRRNKAEFFEIIEEALTQLVVEGFEAQFDQFAEVRNLAWGDTNLFTVENPELFKIATVAEGTNNLRRQRLDKGSFSVTVGTKGVKIYEEMHRFLAGRVDWVGMVNKIAKSYNQEIAKDVYNALYNSFTALGATYGVSGAYDEDELGELVSHVEAATGTSVTILGTKAALKKVVPSVVSDNMKDAKNALGYYATVDGINLMEIKQGHVAGSTDWLINDKFLLIVPTLNDKMVKIVNEGDALITETPAGQNSDGTMEYSFIMKSGIAVVPSAKYGIYRIA